MDASQVLLFLFIFFVKICPILDIFQNKGELSRKCPERGGILLVVGLGFEKVAISGNRLAKQTMRGAIV
ncbi:hypothetical protein SPSIL_024570 [Sporomusa silvacetica DSM 10669]|uniref:Secreted protein n=1 Tax=Sporomusa silvacetica DSM 10669 TaxID=1123289 RepID=A0ABZ3IKV4_9FIRM|nr:hypothetical protein [Sporomusa silvacetica]OZC22735.1 hypothetical protein SPSIL_04790 [Sporomusa silvacetica DSM 10669]